MPSGGADAAAAAAEIVAGLLPGPLLSELPQLLHRKQLGRITMKKTTTVAGAESGQGFAIVDAIGPAINSITVADALIAWSHTDR